MISLPSSSIENNRNDGIMLVSSIKLDSFAKSPENRPSVSEPVAYLGQLGSFSASSGSTAEGSPSSASRPPRPQKLLKSFSDQSLILFLRLLRG
ncbi:hypothetical protein FRX31_006249 [Thalictrum thalictroides]|uniref:Uncharacterized protein n=1 Tax=Thalictrum thalictroides TaxID=46969 RepID=A0A7J6X3B5_THATH|nr:hypothetical protein FRX31_006249 [Thalictrum thalictroides]